MAAFDKAPRWLCVSSLIAQLSVASAQSLFGFSACDLGDVNGDRISDYAVGAPAHPDLRYRGAVWALSGADDSVLYVLQGREDRDGFGMRVSSIGDVSGDGSMDMLVVACGTSVESGRDAYAEVRSGVDGSLLFEVAGLHWVADRSDGAKSSPAGDVDGDGRNDFVALTWPRTGEKPGEIAMVSGRDGSLIWRVDPSTTANGHREPAAAASGCDVNGDGAADVLVGEQGGNCGVVRVLSGRTGETLRVLLGDSYSFGTAVAFVPDRNGDGRKELAASSRDGDGLTRAHQHVGRVAVYSGADDTLLAEIVGPLREPPGSRWRNEFGASIKPCGDLDGDSVEDLLLADPTWNLSTGAVYAFSGSTGAMLYRVTGASDVSMEEPWYFGGALAPVENLDGDAFQDFIVGCGRVTDSATPGYVCLVSGCNGKVLRKVYAPTLEPSRR